MSTPHELLNPESMAPAKGYSNAVRPADGTTIYLSGMTAMDQTAAIVGDTLAEQYDVAMGNVVTGLEAAGGSPTDIVSLVIYTTSMQEYRDDQTGIGRAHRRHLGKHFPAMAMLGVTELYDPEAKLEIIATAVVANEPVK